jgi:hypothetical protein
MSLLALCEWLENTAFSVGMRESTALWPGIICVHALSLMLSVGTILALDIRLVGWGMRNTPVSYIFGHLRPWTLWGFGLTMASGFLLFASEPVKCYKSPSFWIKCILMAAAGVNALIFERQLYPSVAKWDTADSVPPRAKFAGAASIVLWMGVIFCGRWTAYF